MRRALWLVAVVAASVVITAAGVATPARACSCGDRPPVRDEVGAAPMSFVGTVASREPNADGTTTYLVDVEEAISGDVPATVAVVSADDEAACGAQVPVGMPSGFVPIWFEDRWNVSLCGGLVSAVELRAVADERLPAPSGSGPVAGLVLARAGPAQAIAVDASGRPLGYLVLEPPDERVRFVMYGDGCPGGTTAVLGLAVSGESAVFEVAVVALSSLDVVASHEVSGDYLGDWTSIERFDCLSADGDVMTFMSTAATRSDARITVVRDGVAQLLEVPDVDLGAADAAAGAGTDIAVAVDGRIVLVSPDGLHPAVPVVDVGTDIAALDMAGERLMVATGVDGRADRLVGYTSDGAEVSAVDLPETLSMVRMQTSATMTLLRSFEDGRGVAVADDGTIETLGSGAGLLGSTLVTWSYGLPLSVRSEHADALSFVSPAGIRGIAGVDGSVTVDESATGAAALPVIAIAGRIVPVTSPLEPASTDTAPAMAAPSPGAPTNSSEPPVADDGNSSTGLAVAGAVVGGAIGVIGLVGIRRRRRRAQ